MGLCLRHVLVAVATLLVLLLCAEIAVRTVIDAELVSKKLNGRLSSFEGGKFTVSFDDVSASLLPPRIAAVGLHVTDHSLPGEPVVLSIENVAINRINPFVSAWRKGLSAHEIIVSQFSADVIDWQIRRYNAIAYDSIWGITQMAPMAERFRTRVNRSIASALPFIDCNTIQLDNGQFRISRFKETDTMSFSARLINAELNGVIIDSTDAESQARLLYSRDFRFRVGIPNLIFGDSLYELRLGELSGSAESQTIRLDSASVALTMAGEQYSGHGRERRYFYRTGVKGVSIQGLEFDRLFYQEIVAKHIGIDSGYLSLYSDKRMPKNPQRSHPLMPHRAFQLIPWYVRIDSISLGDGEIDYSERADDGARAGKVRFVHSRGVVRNITNDPRLMTVETPAVAELAAEIEGQSPITATIQLPLLSQKFDLAFNGEVRDFRGTILNPMFENLEGIKINSGSASRISFDVRISDGRCTGRLVAPYTDLAAEMINKDDKSQSMLDKLKSIFFDWTTLRDNNLPGDPDDYEVGAIDYVAQPGDPFFKVVWASLRSGIFDVIGIN